MTRTTAAALTALFLLGAASTLSVSAFAQGDPDGMRGTMRGNGENSGGMMGGGMMGRGGMMGGMMGNGGIMGGMMGRDMAGCCAGMMGGMRGGHSGRPNQQWRHSIPAPDQG